MRSLIERFRADQSGATAIEYGLLIGIIGLGMVASLTQIRNAWNAVAAAVIAGLTT